MGITLPILAFGLSVGTTSTQFELDTNTPDALCPELGMAREAVAKRLGTLEVDGGGTWRGVYRIVHDPSGRRGDYVLLTIFDPQGIEQLNREIPIRGESCATLAQAIALIIDGFFRDLGQSLPETPTKVVEPSVHRDAQPTSEKTVPPTTASEQPLPRAPLRAASDVTATPQTNLSKRNVSGSLILGCGIESVPRSAAAIFGLSFATTTHWQLSLRAAIPTASKVQTVESGQASLYSVPVRFSVTYKLPVANRTFLLLGPEILSGIERGRTRGLVDEQPGYRAPFGLGGRLAMAYELSDFWTLAVNIASDGILFNTSRFKVENETVLDSPPVRWSLGLELWGKVFP